MKLNTEERISYSDETWMIRSEELKTAIDLNWLMQLKHVSDDFAGHVLETNRSSLTVNEKVKVILLRKLIKDLILEFRDSHDLLDRSIKG